MTFPLHGTAAPARPCVRCRTRDARHVLRVDGFPLPGAYCCVCTDGRMDELGSTVSKDEHAAGLDSFRRLHLEECGYRPEGWAP